MKLNRIWCVRNHRMVNLQMGQHFFYFNVHICLDLGKKLPVWFGSSGAKLRIQPQNAALLFLKSRWNMHTCLHFIRMRLYHYCNCRSSSTYMSECKRIHWGWNFKSRVTCYLDWPPYGVDNYFRDIPNSAHKTAVSLHARCPSTSVTCLFFI